MNLQTRTKTTGRLARALIVGGLSVAAAGTMNGRDFMPGLATVEAQGPVLNVIAVPWAGREASTHVVYSGASIVLQAVASIGGDGNPVTLTSGTWDPGDGSGPLAIDFSNSRVLELTHAYTGSESTTFFATIAVSDGTTVATDTFKVQIVPQSLDAEVNMAVDRALWYNHKRMLLGTISDASGDHPAGWWTDNNANASTSASVQAFEVNGHRESGDRLKNPYVDDTTRGLRFLESHVTRFTASDLQGHAGTPEDPAPDTNGNGYALQTDGGDLVYVGGQIIDAFVASGTPNAIVIAGSEAGRTYKDLAQDLLDAYSYGQSEDGHGGWVYGWNGNDGIDSSSSGWWGVGARAGDVWGLSIPEWVTTRNFELGIKGTLQYFDGTDIDSDGSCGYRSPVGNAAESGACLIMMAADGVSSTDVRFLATENWLRREFSGGSGDAHGQIYDMYNVTKAMRLAVDGTGASAPITHLGGDLDWYGADPFPTDAASHENGFARYVVANQTSDGRLGQFGSWVSGSTANSWGTLILSTALFEQGPTAVCQADAIVCSAGATCGAATVGAFSTAHFDGTQSVAGDNAIATYKWDFKDATPTSTDVTTTHAFAAVGTYPVTLTVKDTKGNASTATCSVVVSIAALPPLANAGPSGGYAMCLGRSDQIVLSGAASVGRGANIVSYEWDIQAPTNFDAVGATGVTTNQTAYFTGLGAGSWPIKLRVTDSHASPLVDEAGSTVTVRAADDAACNRAPVAVSDSASTVSGTPAIVSVLANDSDPDTWQTLTVSSTTNPTSGSVVVNANQTVTYTANAGFAGIDTFNYTMSDGLGGTASALVTITVTTPPIACSYSTSRNGVVIGRAGGTAVVAVGTQFGCGWVASTGGAFLALNATSGVGGGNVSITVAANTQPAARFAYVTIAGQPVPVAQAGTLSTRPAFDANNDAKVDLLWQHRTSGLLGAWMMDGVRQVSGTLLNPPQVSDTTWKIAGVGDLDGDGIGDLVWQNVVDGRVSAWLMNGVGVRDGSLLSIPQVDPLWRIATVGDFNGDGRADIVWQHQSGAVAVWVMNGLQVVFGTLVPSCVASPMQVVGNGDFNGDGNRDLVFQNPATGAVVVCFTNGIEPAGFQAIDPTPLADIGWKVSGVGDFDRDGKPDLIWQHEVNGSVGVWFMDGLRLRSGSQVVAPGAMDPGWRIVGPR